MRSKLTKQPSKPVEMKWNVSGFRQAFAIHLNQNLKFVSPEESNIHSLIALFFTLPSPDGNSSLFSC